MSELVFTSKIGRQWERGAVNSNEEPIVPFQPFSDET